jgi:hypothetical protein
MFSCGYLFGLSQTQEYQQRHMVPDHLFHINDLSRIYGEGVLICTYSARYPDTDCPFRYIVRQEYEQKELNSNLFLKQT